MTMKGFFTGQVGTQVSQQNKVEKDWKDRHILPCGTTERNAELTFYACLKNNNWLGHKERFEVLQLITRSFLIVSTSKMWSFWSQNW